ncbi:formyl transferase [bacterium]|nr:formyl transferase [bacterium]
MIRPRVILICHADDLLNREGLARWLASFGDLAGIVEIREHKQRKWKRIRRELRRVGPLRFLDVLAFRLYARLYQSARDAQWEADQLNQLRTAYPVDLAAVPTLITDSPNSQNVRAFLTQQQPTLVIARCKTLLAERIFTIPAQGTVVMHPGICPQYRNAHGCFWAMAEDDMSHVGLTVLKIDRGIDTGPIYGYFRYNFDPLQESHHVIQHRTVFENLRDLQRLLCEMAAGTAQPLTVTDTESREWGQPWLTKFLRYRRREQQRRMMPRTNLTGEPVRL